MDGGLRGDEGCKGGVGGEIRVNFSLSVIFNKRIPT